MDAIDLEGTRRIVVIAPWQIERTRGSADLLWNSASFQEMEPEIVENYARLLSPRIRKYIYLKEAPEGKEIAGKRGEVGVLERTMASDYERFFGDFVLRTRDKCVHVTCTNPHAVPHLSLDMHDQMLFERSVGGASNGLAAS